MTPEERENLELQARERAVKIRTVFAQGFKSDSALKALKFIQDELCQYHSHNLVKRADEDLAMNSILHNEGRRSVWVDIRRYLSKETIEKVEKASQILPKRRVKDKKTHPYLKLRGKK